MSKDLRKSVTLWERSRNRRLRFVSPQATTTISAPMTASRISRSFSGPTASTLSPDSAHQGHESCWLWQTLQRTSPRSGATPRSRPTGDGGRGLSIKTPASRDLSHRYTGLSFPTVTTPPGPWGPTCARPGGPGSPHLGPGPRPQPGFSSQARL